MGGWLEATILASFSIKRSSWRQPCHPQIQLLITIHHLPWEIQSGWGCRPHRCQSSWKAAPHACKLSLLSLPSVPPTVQLLAFFNSIRTGDLNNLSSFSWVELSFGFSYLDVSVNHGIDRLHNFHHLHLVNGSTVVQVIPAQICIWKQPLSVNLHLTLKISLFYPNFHFFHFVWQC